MKKFNGKAIYQPAGKAQEYSEWACNFYVGCSNNCSYCYLKKGIGAKILGGDKPTLKKCFRNEKHALEVFEKELKQNLYDLREHGLFFSFTTDPMLPETIKLTWKAAYIASEKKVPVKFLTKKAEWVEPYLRYYAQLTAKRYMKIDQQFYAFGFTLTGHDELEPGASTNAERIEAMKKLHDAGFKTFASIEPIIDFDSSYKMILATLGDCDLYKVGLQSGKKYNKSEIHDYLSRMMLMVYAHDSKLYFKDSLLKQCGISRETLNDPCVNRDYNLFK